MNRREQYISSVITADIALNFESLTILEIKRMFAAAMQKQAEFCALSLMKHSFSPASGAVATVLEAGLEEAKDKYYVPVTYSMRGHYVIEASSADEAIQIALGPGTLLPENPEYLDDSMEIDGDVTLSKGMD